MSGISTSLITTPQNWLQSQAESWFPITNPFEEATILIQESDENPKPFPMGTHFKINSLGTEFCLRIITPIHDGEKCRGFEQRFFLGHSDERATAQINKIFEKRLLIAQDFLSIFEPSLPSSIPSFPTTIRTLIFDYYDSILPATLFAMISKTCEFFYKKNFLEQAFQNTLSNERRKHLWEHLPYEVRVIAEPPRRLFASNTDVMITVIPPFEEALRQNESNGDAFKEYPGQWLISSVLWTAVGLSFLPLIDSRIPDSIEVEMTALRNQEFLSPSLPALRNEPIPQIPLSHEPSSWEFFCYILEKLARFLFPCFFD